MVYKLDKKRNGNLRNRNGYKNILYDTFYISVLSALYVICE